MKFQLPTKRPQTRAYHKSLDEVEGLSVAPSKAKGANSITNYDKESAYSYSRNGPIGLKEKGQPYSPKGTVASFVGMD